MTPRDDSPSFIWELPDDPPARSRAPARPAASVPSAPRAATPPAEPTLTVTQVAARIQALLADGFPEPFWLVGEVSGLARGRRDGGHWYFNLVDDQGSASHASNASGSGGYGGGSSARDRASLNVILWSRTVSRLFGPRGKLGGSLDPEDGLVLRVLVRPDFYAPGGKLSFIIEDVDPEFTLGGLDRQRRLLVQRLQAEGAVAWNKARALAPPALRLGLITAAGSAAWNDVMHTLASSGVGFQVLQCDVRVQGERTGPDVCAALAVLAARGVDAIVLVRGGGSRVDLSWFDREDIARAVAGCGVPVLTGIGHEIDTSVADLVAHRAFKTPTAVAEFLVEAAREARRGSEEAFAQIVARAEQSLADERHSLVAAARGLRTAASSAVQTETFALREASQQLRSACEAGLAEAGAALIEWRSRLSRGLHMERLAGLAARLSGDAARLGPAARALLDRRAVLLDAAEQRARLLDPQAVLARGYAWLRRADGSLLKDAAAAAAGGERLTAVLRDGELELRTLPRTDHTIEQNHERDRGPSRDEGGMLWPRRKT